jgi:AraC family transcriptional regulator, transcriptional activator of the genes for pyochelin and ferripyochelin receptors
VLRSHNVLAGSRSGPGGAGTDIEKYEQAGCAACPLVHTNRQRVILWRDSGWKRSCNGLYSNAVSVNLPVDFSRFLEATLVQRVLPLGAEPIQGTYGDCEGLQLRTLGRGRQLSCDVVRLTDDALLLATDVPAGGGQHQQAVNDADWIHIQFRLNGDGHERLSTNDLIETPPRSCVVARYPQNCVVERTSHGVGAFQVVCLLLRPRALTRLLDVSASKFPEQAQWIAQEDSLALQTARLPLSSKMHLAVNDILSCQFKAAARRGFMRAKSLELLSNVVHALDTQSRESPAARLPLSPRDVEKIERARAIMLEELGSSLTLAALARRVGLNRTKLAVGFKEIYGVSVQAWWRDARLSHARELLQGPGARVTDVALNLGYSELSSFTRAFSRKFGFVPKALKSGKD